MNLNTNLSNPANYSAISFQAVFNTKIPVKDVERLVNIKTLFAQKTQHYPSDKLTLAMSKDPIFSEYPVLTTTFRKINCGDYKYAHLINNFDELMQSMTDEQIVKKLINYFKTMKKEEQYDNYTAGIKKTIEKLKALKTANQKAAQNCANSGKNEFASRYRTLAEINQGKIDFLNAKKQKDVSRILNDIDKITAKEPDLQHVSKTILETEAPSII